MGVTFQLVFYVSQVEEGFLDRLDPLGKEGHLEEEVYQVGSNKILYK